MARKGPLFLGQLHAVLRVLRSLRQWGRVYRLGLLALCVALVVGWLAGPGLALGSRANPSGSQAQRPTPDVAATPKADPLAAAQRLYQQGQFQAALGLLQQAEQQAKQQGDRRRQALIWANLSLTHQQLGQWAAAETAIAQAQKFVPSLGPDDTGVLAQVLDIQGRLQFAKGDRIAAALSWEQAAQIYKAAGDSLRQSRSQLQQVRALQAGGLHHRAQQLLAQVQAQLAAAPDSVLKVTTLQTLGEILLNSSNLDRAEATLNQGLALATQLQFPEQVINLHLSLGNLARFKAFKELGLRNLTIPEALALLASDSSGELPDSRSAQISLRAATLFRQQMNEALSAYNTALEQARTLAAQAPTPELTRLSQRARLQSLSLLAELQRWDDVEALYPALMQDLSQQPPSRDVLFDRLELAQSLLSALKPENPAPQISGLPVKQSAKQSAKQAGKSLPSLLPKTLAAFLSTTAQQADQIGDRRSQSYALGLQASLYEQSPATWPQAQRLTEAALQIAQGIKSPEISYRWQWQLGRLQALQGQTPAAIATYQLAVNTLESLRGDLVGSNRDIQFSFRESVEPVYRELVSLLLKAAPPAIGASSTGGSNTLLNEARQVVEKLQLAELDNFFREACLDARFDLDRSVDQANSVAAVLYTIVLDDHLAVILKQPGQPPLAYSTPVSKQDVETTVDTFLQEVKDTNPSPQVIQKSGQQLYDWLIRPAEKALAEGKPQTLVFVLDGPLRSIPIAALYDGQRYLVEKYSVAVAPGLQLPEQRSLQPQTRQAMLAGLSEARPPFSSLPSVEQELKDLGQKLPSTKLLNQDFTTTNFQTQIAARPFPIVHIATHGQFSSNIDDTYILTWDQRLPVEGLSRLLQRREAEREPIELLVLSACQTATGDRRAALGLAGVAIRAGARSTIASLWSVSDASTAQLMERFYQGFVGDRLSRAEALRQAQVALLQDENYKAPRYWAPFILLGSWL